MRTKKKRSDRLDQGGKGRNRHMNRGRRRALKAVTGAIIGGIIAGPVGAAAGAMAGASVRRGPIRRNVEACLTTKPVAQRKARKPSRAARPRNDNLGPK